VFGVIFHAGIDHARRAVDKADDLGEVRRGNDPSAPLLQLAQHAAGDGGALLRLGPCPQFIQKHQGARSGLAQDGGDAGHVGREGREALFDGLLVADVHQQRV